MDLEKYQALKARVDELQSEKLRAQGALQQIKKQLVKEFGCNLAEAESLLADLEKEHKQMEKEFETELKRFEKQWGELLEAES